MKKTILWLSNCPFTETPGNSTGTWLSSLGQALVKSGEIQLANVSQGKMKKHIRKDCGSIRQWILPFKKTESSGFPPEKTVQTIQTIVDEIQPDPSTILSQQLRIYDEVLSMRGHQ